MTPEEYLDLDGVAMAELVQAGEVTASELVDAAIARAEAVNPRLNAIVHPMYEQARERARELDAEDVGGPFRGVPFLVKDLLSLVAGEPYRAGSRMMEGFVPDHDTELVRRYRASGVALMGQTNDYEGRIFEYGEMFAEWMGSLDLDEIAAWNVSGLFDTARRQQEAQGECV